MNKSKIVWWLITAGSVALIAIGLGIADGDLNASAFTAVMEGRENYLSLFAKMELTGLAIASAGGLLLYLMLKRGKN